jgi:hypothetical protein
VARTHGSKDLTPDQVSWIVERATAGWSYTDIAFELGVDKSTVARRGRVAIGLRNHPDPKSKRRRKLTEPPAPTI